MSGVQADQAQSYLGVGTIAARSMEKQFSAGKVKGYILVLKKGV